MTEDHFVTVVIQIQASLECPHDAHRQWRWDILLHNGESDDTIAPSKPTGKNTTPIGFVVPPMPIADSGFSWLHSTWRPCSASNLHHLSSCCFPKSTSWAPVSHRTSPGSRVTNVQETQRKKGLRSVGPATVMNPFEVSSGLIARLSYLSSLRCPRFPSGHSRAQCPSLRHLAHFVRSSSC